MNCFIDVVPFVPWNWPGPQPPHTARRRERRISPDKRRDESATRLLPAMCQGFDRLTQMSLCAHCLFSTVIPVKLPRPVPYSLRANLNVSATPVKTTYSCKRANQSLGSACQMILTLAHAALVADRCVGGVLTNQFYRHRSKSIGLLTIISPTIPGPVIRPSILGLTATTPGPVRGNWPLSWSCRGSAMETRLFMPL
jgi:hypothetical protein